MRRFFIDSVASVEFPSILRVLLSIFRFPKNKKLFQMQSDVDFLQFLVNGKNDQICRWRFQYSTYLLFRAARVSTLVYDASHGSENINWGDPLTEASTSGWGSFWERSSNCSWFSPLKFRKASGIAPDCIRTLTFRTNLSNFDRAPRFRFSIQLNPWHNMFSNLLFSPSNTSVTQSSWIPGTIMFSGWLILRFSKIFSLLMIASFFFKKVFTQSSRLN